MKKTPVSLAVLLAILCFCGSVSAEERPSAKGSLLDQLDWLVGHWKGEAFGGIAEEVWSPASAGTMMGSYRLVVGGKVRFYELVVLSEHEDGLSLRLKHFHPDMTGWEEKDEVVEFPFVEFSPDKVVFDGFVIEKVSNDRIRITVQIDENPMPFDYRRVE